MNKFESINNKKSVAYYSGFGGLEIKSIEYGIDDKVEFIVGAWCNKRSAHKVKIHYSNNIPYFKFNGIRIKLDECIIYRV